MHLEGEHTGAQGRVVVHDGGRFVGGGIEHTDTADWERSATDTSASTPVAEREVAPTVLPR